VRSTGEIIENPDFICDWVVDLSTRYDDASDDLIVESMLRV
jgi:hypothetical protein